VLDVVATRSADGHRLFVKAVNTDLEHSLAALIRVRGVKVAAKATLERVHADSLSAVNSFRTPDAVRISSQSLPGSNALSVVLPSHSVSVITLDLLPH
jgi:alpha-L-arabinofuranosidase